jgi:hypothetical protein
MEEEFAQRIRAVVHISQLFRSGEQVRGDIQFHGKGTSDVLLPAITLGG